jgi:hypothetical protein
MAVTAAKEPLAASPLGWPGQWGYSATNLRDRGQYSYCPRSFGSCISLQPADRFFRMKIDLKKAMRPIIGSNESGFWTMALGRDHVPIR